MLWNGIVCGSFLRDAGASRGDALWPADSVSAWCAMPAEGAACLCLLLAAGAAAGLFCHGWAASWLRRQGAGELFAARRTGLALAGALLMLALACDAPQGEAWLRWTVLCFLLLAICCVDGCSCWIPDEMILAGLLLYPLLLAAAGPVSLGALAAHAVEGVLVAGGLWLFGALASGILGRQALGGGDVKLFLLLGVYLGAARAVLALFAAAFLALPALLWPGARRGMPIPFGPPVAAAVWLAALWGDPLLEQYWQFWL